MPQPRCERCFDDGMVCENHPDKPWGLGREHGGCDCGAGIPCPACCSPVPQDGAHSIADAFVPDWQRRP